MGSLKITNSIEEMKQEIYDNGPVMVGFIIFGDFMYYESGIYRATDNTVLGGHAVMVHGWGIDAVDYPGELYWIAQN